MDSEHDISISINHQLPEISASFIKGGNWGTIQARRHHKKEAIHMKDLRAVSFGWRRKCRQAKNHHKHHLFLCDNMGM
eukprot:4258208-Pyramimonas_sp.AAC.1